MAPGRRRRTSSPPPEAEEPSSGDEDNAPPMSQMTFSQVVPDRSQSINIAKDSEIRNLENLNPTARNRIVTDLSRILLFKGLNGDVIDRKKVIAEALGDMKAEKVHGAILKEAEKRLSDVFGFSLKRVPVKMEEDLPSRFKDRLYLINDVKDDPDGTHAVNLHSAHPQSGIEKGVLMVILGFAFCKGSPARTGIMKGAGKKTRWITEHQLYNLMHRVDENIPAEPPSVEGKKKRPSGGRPSIDAEGLGGGVSETPDLDALLEKFVHLDYLLRDKIDESDAGRESQAGEDGKVTAYAMGPRAAMEIGRKQIVYFCSNVLDEQPDPTMIAEIDEDEESEEEEDDEEEEEEEEEEEVVEEEPEPKGKRAKRVKKER